MDLEQTARTLLEFRSEKHRICAITTWKGRVTAIGVNSYVKTHPEQKRLATRVGHSDRQFLHAEISALIKAKKADAIHIFRLGKAGEWRNAKPCPICDLAIRERYITKVHHT